MKHRIRTVLLAAVAVNAAQSAGHPFETARIVASIDSFVVVTRVTPDRWRPIGGVVQTVARDSGSIRIAVEYAFADSRQRVEMAMDASSLAPLAHWESLSRRDRGDTRGEVMFRDGRARGAFILSRGVIDMPLDAGVVDDDASTALLAALPLDTGRVFTFRTFASPGAIETTSVRVAGLDTVTVPAGRFPSYRLVVMARDTSDVFISRDAPHRVVLVRLRDGSQEMRLVNAR